MGRDKAEQRRARMGTYTRTPAYALLFSSWLFFLLVYPLGSVTLSCKALVSALLSYLSDSVLVISSFWFGSQKVLRESALRRSNKKFKTPHRVVPCMGWSPPIRSRLETREIPNHGMNIKKNGMTGFFVNKLVRAVRAPKPCLCATACKGRGTNRRENVA